ncbi:cupin domain-containing protein [Pectobacterium odoriferum]|uniref:cupin domain-containing protein n=1 Tax=Pectobacterium odoriferum TaxID=78398 RepID=UPI000CD02326|nr:cupin domain-containing protein [Pectobacterium odoriferum]POD91501.1 cupin [Pectobacterium odoriferum]POD99714.1 cupin [Pectobacterium odoriferum]POE03420.1 cupin [Pectobacterium odoriferum]
MTRFASLDTTNTDVQVSSPQPTDLLKGMPEFRLWEIENAGKGVSAGIWESTPGKWRFANTHWEYFRVLFGVSVITDDDGSTWVVRTGDSLVLRPGFQGTWEVIETTRKEYVVCE